MSISLQKEQEAFSEPSPPRRILAVLQKSSSWSRDLIRVLKPARFSFFILLASIAALLTGPGQDLLRSAGERPLNDVLHWLFLGAGVYFWASCIWYWARVILRFKHEIDEEPGAESKKSRYYVLRLRTPRWLGTLALAGLSIALFLAARSYQSTDWFNAGDPAFKLWLLTIGALMLTVVFAVFVTFRQRLLAYLASSPMLPEPVRCFFEPLPEEAHYSRGAHIFKDLSRATRIVSRVSLGVSLTLLLLFSSNSIAAAIAPAFGALTILFFAFGVWVFLGTLLVFLARRTRLPILTLGIIAILAFSQFNDNHRIRTLDRSRKSMAGVLSVEDHVRQWNGSRPAGDSLSHAPIFLVAAEGGGVRAAYWTSLVLSALQDTIYAKTNERVYFSDHVYAISGASGGSIGAGVFTALVAEEKERGAAFRKNGASYVHYTRQILKRDFLSPIFAKFVVSDLVQRILPIPINALDRGAALERSFERAWGTQFGAANRFEDSFASLWNDHPYRVPSLIVNATHVESGRRMLTTNLPVDRTFADALDLRFEVENEMPLSTALHNGARFPYLNPAGTIRNHNRWLGRIRGHVADGGYFDNSGATSLKEVYNVLEDENLRDRVYVIWISNSPLETVLGDTSLIEPTFHGLYEALTPPRTILNTRDARARQAINDLQQTVGPHRLFTFALCKYMTGEQGRKAALPLSWDLSEQAMADMTMQWKHGCEYSNNPESLREVVQLFYQ